MEYCFSKERIKCIYLTRDNYEELLQEDYPDYKNDYIKLEITDEGIIVNPYDMVHVSKTYRFGWWDEEDVDKGYLSYGKFPEWHHYTDDEFNRKFTKGMACNETWILCAERCPGISDCKYYDDSLHEHYDAFWVTMLENNWGLTCSTKMCYRPERGLWYKDGSDMCMVGKVIAWMPLVKPKAYQLQKKEDGYYGIFNGRTTKITGNT